MRKLAMIGAGAMADALISGMIDNNLMESKKIWVTNRSDEKKLTQLQEKYKVCTSHHLEETLADADVVVLVMKPKDAADAINNLKAYLQPHMLIVSVLAGISIETIEKLAGKPLSIVRAMPNTSAAIGKSATAIAINERVTEKQMLIVKGLFETVGLTTVVEENQLDAVTGLSGSGPAYIYYLVEAMEKSAVEIGLEQQMAKELIIQTLIGAAGMLSVSKKAPLQLRQDVTSPGGTTEAGIRVLEKHGVQNAFVSCIKEAAAQSQRLGSMLSEQMK
ncbi:MULTISPECIES: pyrroline-5-carboxylate reductase [unclassified Bacillus (in: firmicutes)]|uniref:pyrroline-5-carboxylate reductase n=1 Tax=unclassified Bacillus (in: firmicutes) TaxID=185979 RepID=UPI0008E3901C|nr:MULTISPECIES: pyrroline-5-carboxylate reductase [unclassified Bacillus (in: firmicutes)]SFA97382.1 pyrroline-5-carboxylate reductase [Bacillus sp. UNCCL13]SFQ80463.1 pyrroline-5-carboxylate reductase [Bacillus sp. cl95]